MGNEQIKIYINEELEKSLGASTTVREVIVELLEGDEGFLFLEESEEPLDVERTIGELGIQHHGHLHAHRCRHIEVTVEYAGKSAQQKFGPTVKIKAVRDWAVSVKDFEIEGGERSKFALFEGDSDDPLKESSRLGSLVGRGHCEISLQLSLRDRHQG